MQGTRRSPTEGRGHPTRLLVGLLVRPEHGAEAGEHEGAQPPGPLLVAAVVVQGVGGQHEPVLPRPNPGGLHTAPHLPLQPAWKGKPQCPPPAPSTPAALWHRTGSARSPPAPPAPLGQDPATVRARSCQPRLLQRQRPLCPSPAVPTFHESVRVILHWPRALLHDEAAHLLCDEQGPGDDMRLSPGAHGYLPRPPSMEPPGGWGEPGPQGLRAPRNPVVGTRQSHRVQMTLAKNKLFAVAALPRNSENEQPGRNVGSGVSTGRTGSEQAPMPQHPISLGTHRPRARPLPVDVARQSLPAPWHRRRHARPPSAKPVAAKPFGMAEG